MNFDAIEVDSPVEFVIVGPVEGRDRILVKSAAAGLDLVGLAAEDDTSDGDRVASRSDILAIFFPSARKLNVIRSFPFPDFVPNFDGRSSRLSFAWKGFATRSGVKRIEESFKLRMSDLHRAIKDQNRPDLEWAIAPIILKCSYANEGMLRFRRVIAVTSTIYALLALLVIAIGFLRITTVSKTLY